MNHDYVAQTHCMACKADYQSRYYRQHKERIRIRKKRTDAEWYPNNKWRFRGYRVKRRALMLQKVAEFHGDPVPRCRIDLTSASPVSDLPCRGILTIDHMNGGGRKDVRGASLTYAIARGDRKLDDIRLLCQVHQLWNQIRTTYE